MTQTNTAALFDQEVREGKRFEFGKNWKAFLETLDDDRIARAENSLKTMLGVESLEGKSFIDIGSGSGLFSLVARRLGATVHSFDFDTNSVGCTAELRRRYFPDDPNWTVEQGSALDKEYLASLGTFDVVYSWGVLHHTGEMWNALDNVHPLVKPGGMLYIALYNEQGAKSRFWHAVKKTYCSGPLGKALICAIFIPIYFARAIASSIVFRRNTFRHYRGKRGMSITHDWFDWLGGYPFEVASPEQILTFYRRHGFEMVNMTTTNSLACNQFVLQRKPD